MSKFLAATDRQLLRHTVYVTVRKWKADCGLVTNPNLERARSFPAWVPACVSVSINFKYCYRCGVGKNIGLAIWTDFLPAVKVCNNHSL